jgi:phosphate transport system protein
LDSDFHPLKLIRGLEHMTDLVQSQVKSVLDAYAAHDLPAAMTVWKGDEEVDAICTSLFRELLTYMMEDPRNIGFCIHLMFCAKNIGKRVSALDGDFHPLKLIRGFEHMSALVQSQLKSVLDAYAAQDLPAAMTVWKGDEEVDSICTSLFRELLTYMMEDPRNIGFCIHLMFCAKNIERIGDHATNIAETVFYMIEGQPIGASRPKGDMTSFSSTSSAS